MRRDAVGLKPAVPAVADAFAFPEPAAPRAPTPVSVVGDCVPAASCVSSRSGRFLRAFDVSVRRFGFDRLFNRFRRRLRRMRCSRRCQRLQPQRRRLARRL